MQIVTTSQNMYGAKVGGCKWLKQKERQLPSEALIELGPHVQPLICLMIATTRRDRAMLSVESWKYNNVLTFTPKKLRYQMVHNCNEAGPTRKNSFSIKMTQEA